jgi:hypothetical protein
MDPGVLVRHQIERWQDAGLLVQGPSGHESGLPLPRPQTARAASSLGTCEIDKARFSLYRLIQHAWNSIWVRNHIRWSGLSSAIRAIQLLPAPAAQPPQMELLRHLGQAMRGYQAARRPLAQGRPDCLTRSLALLRTLRQEGIDASICIGVRKCPFAAHAWVEAGGLTVNDTVENTSQYFVIVSF